MLLSATVTVDRDDVWFGRREIYYLDLTCA